MTPAQVRFAADFAKHVGDRALGEWAKDAAERICKADPEDLGWETFASAVKDLQWLCERKGARHLGEPARGEFLDEAIPKALLFWIDHWDTLLAGDDAPGQAHRAEIATLAMLAGFREGGEDAAAAWTYHGTPLNELRLPKGPQSLATIQDILYGRGVDRNIPPASDDNVPAGPTE